MEFNSELRILVLCEL